VLGGGRRPAACLPPLTTQNTTSLGFRVFYPLRAPYQGGFVQMARQCFPGRLRRCQPWRNYTNSGFRFSRFRAPDRVPPSGFCFIFRRGLSSIVPHVSDPYHRAELKIATFGYKLRIWEVLLEPKSRRGIFGVLVFELPGVQNVTWNIWISYFGKRTCLPKWPSQYIIYIKHNQVFGNDGRTPGWTEKNNFENYAFRFTTSLR